MQNQALAPAFFGSFVAYLRGVCLMLLFLVAFDWGQSGSVRVENVTFYNAQSKTPSIVSLPLKINSLGRNGYYEFEVPLSPGILGYVFPVRIVARDCISRIEITGILQDIKQIAWGDPCNSGRGILLKPAFVKEFYGRTISIHVREKNGEEVGLKLRRDTLLTINQRVVVSAFALGLLVLSLTDSWRGMWAACRRCVVIAAGAFVLWWYDWLWDEWPNYALTGVYVSTVVLLLALWQPVRWAYAWVEDALVQILAIPDKRFIQYSVGSFVVLTAFLSQYMFEGMPHVADTHIQYVQSKIFASGKLYEKSPPLRDFFEFQNAINNGKYFAATFPGQPILLAIGQVFHVPWLVNPIMGALTIWLVFLIARELAGKAAGCTAVALMFLSPMIVFMSSEYMSHTPCTFFLMLFMYHYIRLLNTGDKKHAIIAGSAVGFALLTRLQATIPFMSFIGIHALWTWVKSPKKYNKPMCCMVAAFSVPLLFLLYFQYVTTGNPWSNGYMLKAKDNYPVLFKEFMHLDRWTRIGEDLERLIEQIQVTQLELFGWPTSSLWGLIIFFIIGLHIKGVIIPLLSILGQYACFIFLFRDNGSGVFFANRFLFESSASIIILSAVGFVLLVRNARTAGLQQWLPYPAASMAIIIALLSIAAFPYYTWEKYKLLSDNYWEGDMQYVEMIKASVNKPALVIISPYKHFRFVYFNQPPHDDDEIIYVRDLGARNEQIINHYPNRHVYRADWWKLLEVRPALTSLPKP